VLYRHEREGAHTEALNLVLEINHIARLVAQQQQKDRKKIKRKED
jgi:hypothetical protein